MTNRLHLYTGGGKGKTTAAMGLALRSLGHGRSVLIAQFLKDGSSGEIAALRTFDTAHIFDMTPVKGFVFQMSDKERAEAAQSMRRDAQRLEAWIAMQRPVLIVLDEMAGAMETGLLPDEDARMLLDAALEFGETVITGRKPAPWLLARADYITQMEAMRHPYDVDGLEARKGIEW